MQPARADDAPWLREPRGRLFASARVRIGRFRRHPAEADFASAGQIDQPVIVFPRLAVRIAQAGKRAVVADPTQVMLYDAGQEYRRAPVAPEGDRCDWFAYQPADVAEALRPAEAGGGPAQSAGSAPSGEPARFAEPCLPAPGPLVLLARRLFLAATSALTEPLAIEEGSLALLWAALEPVRAARGARAAALLPSQAELAAAAQGLLARSFTTRVTLSGLAAALGCSPFHLCRAFRAATGWTVHRHLTALRLRAALEQLPERRRELAALALELGFSHHAHLTAAFRRAYAITPSEWVRQVRRAGGAERARIG